MTKIGIVTGSIRDTRINLQVAEWLKTFADQKGLSDVQFEILDIKETGLQNFNPSISTNGRRIYIKGTDPLVKASKGNGWIYLCYT